MNEIDWAAWREEFPGLRRSTYLNTVSLGQLSVRSRAAMNQFMDLWTESGSAAWYAFWLKEQQATREEFARLIGADPQEVAIMPNVSSALGAISSCLDFAQRSQVVTTALDFPTLTYHWLAKEREGLEAVILAAPDGIQVPLSAFERAVGGNTALIATSRVYFTTGFIQDVDALAELAHRNGALLLVDDYQATGQVPIDVRQTPVDVLVTGGLKWLLGGPGIAYLYVRRELIQTLQPTMTGWFSNARQFDFDPHRLEFHEDARRFEAGTPSVASIYAGKAGLEIINEIGAVNVRHRTAELREDLVGRLTDRGFRLRLPPDPDTRSGITIVELEDPMAVTRALAERRIIVDKRPGAVRLSPYFYNTPEENELVVEALTEITRGSG
ncbi:MAG TPA: aminotransferase class V-fold PLP-dependent enzyme [Anaerolineales bacterium]|nr:aminotransferase class V-fold PLP-dependent enzyme [Anaerolineales bacterium]